MGKINNRMNNVPGKLKTRMGYHLLKKKKDGQYYSFNVLYSYSELVRLEYYALFRAH